jgi:hypothetical protein
MRLIAVDNSCSSIVIAVSLYYRRISISIVVAVFLYDNRLISVSIVFAVPVAVIRPNGYANGPNTDSDLFCYGRHCAKNTCNCGSYHCKTSSHFVLLDYLLETL